MSLAGWFPRLFILPHVIIGIGLIIYPIVMLVSTICGTEVKGVVTDKHSHVDSEDGRIYNIEIDYKYNNEDFDEKLSVSKKEYKQFEVGNAVDVRFLPALRGMTQCVKPSGEGNYKTADLGTICFFIFFATFWNAIVSVFVMILYVAPLVNWWLFRFGAVCPGVVLHKSSNSDSDGTTYHADYTYAPGKKAPLSLERGSTICEGGMAGKNQVKTTGAVPSDIWQHLIEGQDICVLYSPRWPKVHCVYEFSDCELKT